jgi:hypothetical protein
MIKTIIFAAAIALSPAIQAGQVCWYIDGLGIKHVSNKKEDMRYKCMMTPEYRTTGVLWSTEYRSDTGYWSKTKAIQVAPGEVVIRRVDNYGTSEMKIRR